MTDLINNTFLAYLGRENDQPVDLNSKAIKQVTPKNEFLGELNNSKKVPTDLLYNAIYGDIDAEIRQKVFFFDFRKRISIGDGLISAKSASGIPVGDLRILRFSEEPILDIHTRITKLPFGNFEYRFDAPGFSDLRVKHGSIISFQDVVGEVLRILGLQ